MMNAKPGEEREEFFQDWRGAVEKGEFMIIFGRSPKTAHNTRSVA